MFGLNGRQQLGLLVIIALVFAATQYVPPYFTAFQFNDFVRQEVKFAAAARKTTEQVRASIVQRAGEADIELSPRDVVISRRGPSFTVDIEYRFPVNMRLYRHELVFTARQSGEIFDHAFR